MISVSVIPAFFRHAAAGLLDAVYPPLCSGCGKGLNADEEGLCGACRHSLEPLSLSFCQRCGYPLDALDGPTQGDTCRECPPKPCGFSLARSIYSYQNEVIRNLIHGLKFDYLTPNAKLLGQMMADHFDERFDPKDFDAIVPIPLHRHRLRQREFNQAALIAQTFAERAGLTLRQDLLVRKRQTPPQTKQSIALRHKNMAGAFECPNPDKAQGLKVLLIDDVMTTGATVNEAGRTLMKSGAARVCVYTVARTMELGAG